jgi:plasmid stabilization system protein ParE
MEVIWTEKATLTFETLASYIDNDFGRLSAQKFIAKADSVIRTIANHPYAYKQSSVREKVRKAFVTKQCSLFYEIKDDFVVLLYFWDNRQKPSTI